MKPNHVHDCDTCTLIGIFATNELVADVYVHNDTLLYRYGSEGPEYSSFPIELARSVAERDHKWKLTVAAYDAWKLML